MSEQHLNASTATIAAAQRIAPTGKTDAAQPTAITVKQKAPTDAKADNPRITLTS